MSCFKGGEKQSSDRTNVAGRFAESTPTESSKSCPMSFGNGQEGIDGAPPGWNRAHTWLREGCSKGQNVTGHYPSSDR